MNKNAHAADHARKGNDNDEQSSSASKQHQNHIVVAPSLPWPSGKTHPDSTVPRFVESQPKHHDKHGKAVRRVHKNCLWFHACVSRSLSRDLFATLPCDESLPQFSLVQALRFAEFFAEPFRGIAWRSEPYAAFRGAGAAFRGDFCGTLPRNCLAK